MLNLTQHHQAKLNFKRFANTQAGYLMPLAVFLIIILGGLALTISRYTATANVSAHQEMITVASFYAADAGGQWGMNQLFYSTLSPIDRNTVRASCVALNGASNIVFSVPGLNNCSASLACNRNTQTDTDFYTITSVGACGSGSIRAERTVVVSAFMQ